ncbi:MAG TPA: hypothetical protein VFT99_16430, partial [Roseiflexaceae bacterium]|nr:hypothetical protein [Roseiflexaceae bacterium]
MSPVLPTAPKPTQITAAPTATLPPLTAPTQVPTRTLLPTSTPLPTSLPEPSSVPTQAPTIAATAAPSAVPTAVPATSTALPAPTQAPTEPSSAIAHAQLLFLRGGDLYALNMDTRKTRLLVEDVADFAPSVDGAQLALLRGTGTAAELWLSQRDGSSLTRLTKNTRAEATPRWSPDGRAVVYASSTASTPYEYDWFAWSNWCAASEVRVLDLATLAETTLAPGCDPA